MFTLRFLCCNVRGIGEIFLSGGVIVSTLSVVFLGAAVAIVGGWVANKKPSKK